MNQTDAPAVVAATPDANATDLLLERIALTPEAPLFARQQGDTWVDVSGRDYLVEVRALAKGLIAAGIEPGEKIGLMAKTRYEWTLIDFAAWFAGAILVPIYETSSPSQVHWNLSDAGAHAVIVESPEHFAKFDEVAADLPDVRLSWQIDRGDLGKLAASGVGVSDEELERRRSLANEDDIATIIYTSGTTGRPKGCVLTHRNFVELCRNTQAAIPEVIKPGSSTVLFIPTAHIFARFIAVLCVYGGVKVGHQPDTTKLVPTLGSFQPTFLLAVPRVFEKVYNSAEQKAEAGGKGKIFRRAADVAVAHSEALDAGKVPLGLKLQYALFDRLVYGKLRTTLGGRVEYAVSGSAPLGHRLGHFYRSLGVTILEGYGLTETTAPATVNRPSDFHVGSVGPALPGVSIRVEPDGEILVKGVNVFREYWNNAAATAEAFHDEWFRTGDIGEINEHGHLKITGRKKELIVTAGGKNVAPAVLEDPIRANPIVGQVVVVGDRKPFIGALVTLDTEMLPVWLKNNGHGEGLTVQQAAQHPEVRAEIQRAIDHANSQVSRPESIRKFTILPTEWTEASGHLTPKLSIKRNVILTDYATAIEDMYAGAPTLTESTPTVG
ncbi:MAG: long-chain fatty acid--CoA ligase [Naasia sp.]|nr:long-chain fatty acid--CoA ligase [Naasia sp.]